MPWRKNTLTAYRSSSLGSGGESDAELSEKAESVLMISSANGDGHRHAVQSDDNLSTGGQSDNKGLCFEDLDNLFGPVDIPELLDLQRDASSSSVKDSGALDLGLSQVPRGKRLDEDNMMQFLGSAFLQTRKRQKVEMPWEKGPMKLIFQKKCIIPKPCKACRLRG